jgi:carbamoyl-phosphate synthase small subunit
LSLPEMRSMSLENVKGLLVVGDEIFEGVLFGAVQEDARKNIYFGEIVFNTSMTGYQEIMTDPSYAGQMVCFTTAHIGNTGANAVDVESKKVYAEGAIIASYTEKPSNFRSEETFSQFLKNNGRIGIHSVDTRALTIYLRSRGVTPGFILPESEKARIPELKKELVAKNYAAMDWILKTTTKEPHWVRAKSEGKDAKYKVVAYDYGVKGQLIKELAMRGCDVLVVPADYPSEKVMQENPQGIFLTNGPGDPSLATYAVKNVKELLGKKPIFGVCMGHQVLAMALGAKTYKLKFGHRGGNQPVKNLATNAVEISSHNHGYAVDAKTLPSTVGVTHSNLNDECCEGISAPSLQAFSVQYHPESSPGPHDSSYLFDQFIGMMK